MRIVKTTAGILLTSLGALWMLQGADLIRIKPVLCFADCEPIAGGSTAWLVVGLISLVIGLFLLVPGRPRI